MRGGGSVLLQSDGLKAYVGGNRIRYGNIENLENRQDDDLYRRSICQIRGVMENIAAACFFISPGCVNKTIWPRDLRAFVGY